MVAGCVLACAGVVLTPWTLVPALTGSWCTTLLPPTASAPAPPIWWTLDQHQYSVTRVSLKYLLCNVLMITRNITAVVEMVQGVCVPMCRVPPSPSVPPTPCDLAWPAQPSPGVSLQPAPLQIHCRPAALQHFCRHGGQRLQHLRHQRKPIQVRSKYRVFPSYLLI